MQKKESHGALLVCDMGDLVCLICPTTVAKDDRVLIAIFPNPFSTDFRTFPHFVRRHCTDCCFVKVFFGAAEHAVRPLFRAWQSARYCSSQLFDWTPRRGRASWLRFGLFWASLRERFAVLWRLVARSLSSSSCFSRPNISLTQCISRFPEPIGVFLDKLLCVFLPM